MSTGKSYSIIIPVLNYSTGSLLDGLLATLAKQTLKPESVHIIAGDRRQGRAINYGVSQTDTEYIATLDDDTQIDDPELFHKLITAMEQDSSIGMAGAACAIPDSATSFQKKAMKQIPRRFFPVQTATVDSDMVQHPCLLMRRKLFLEIGGEDERLIRGLDPVLRKKVRDAGKRVVIVADTAVYHLIPDNFFQLLKMYYRNGFGSGYAARNYPEKVLELTDGYDNGQFTEKRPFHFRVLRRILSFITAVCTLKFIKAATDIAYSFGVIKGKWFSSDTAVPKIKNITDGQDTSGMYPFKLCIHRVELAE